MNQDIQLLKYLATVDKSIGRMYEKLIKELAKVGATIDDFASGAFFSFKDYPQVKERVEKILDDYSQALEAKITNGMTEAINMSYLANTTFLKDYSRLSDKALAKQRETATKAFIQSRTKSAYGLGLSDKVWNYTQQAKAEFEAGMSELIEEGITAGISAEELGRKLRSKLNNPDMVYRRYHLKKLTETGKKDVVEWRKKVVDEDGKVHFIKTEMDLVGRGVYRSSRKNALRLAATEINMAYRYADNVRWQSEPFIRGIRIRLSGNHTLNGKPFYDICDELQGDYPKTFMWSGWHPRCYSDDSEVLTTDGWKLFKNVTLFDGIYSLNPNNRCHEIVPVHSSFKWWNDGSLIHIHSDDIDCLVTKDHEIVIDNNGSIERVEASLFDCSSHHFIGSTCFSKKSEEDYHGYVYDLELERNHIMYIRRNGKCFWGSNCRCSASPILIPQEEMDKIYKLPEDEYQNYRPKDLITEMPDKFKSWFEKNKDKIEASINRGTQPYFIRDNQPVINNLLHHDTNSYYHVLSERYDSTLKNERKRLIRQGNEYISIINQKGSIIYQMSGHSRSVFYDDDIAKMAKNNILTHNHPTGKKEKGILRFGYSLSSDDVYEAVRCDMMMIVAEAPYYRYSLKRPDNGWKVDAKEVKSAYARIYKDIKSEYNEQISYHDAINIIQHLTMKRIAKQYGFIYNYQKMS